MFIGVLIAWCAYMILSEKAPGQYAEKLLDDKIELDFQGDDIRALFKEMEELLQYGEDGWSLGRVTVRQSKNSKETIKYDNIYLYYKPEDEAESIYRRIRILNENARWYVVEALQQDKVHELVHMDENMSETMLKEIWMSVEEQVNICFSEDEECEISVTSKEVNITVFSNDDKKDKSIARRRALLIKRTEDGYQLEELPVYSD